MIRTIRTKTRQGVSHFPTCDPTFYMAAKICSRGRLLCLHCDGPKSPASQSNWLTGVGNIFCDAMDRSS
jgi:hypothetical protein